MSSYHGWTHAPKSQGGTDPIPGSSPILYGYLWRTTSTTTLSNGSPLFVSGYSVSLVGADNEAFEHDPTNGYLKVLQPGIVQVRLEWGLTVAAGPLSSKINCSNDGTIVQTGADWYVTQDGANQNGYMNHGGLIIVETVDASPGYIALSATVSQTSGSDKTLREVILVATWQPLP